MRPATNHLEASLDLALDLTFPASDPVAVCLEDTSRLDDSRRKTILATVEIPRLVVA